MSQSLSARDALRHPRIAAGAIALLPVLGAARWRADIVILCLLWLLFCRLWSERWFGRARPDGVAPAAGLLRGASVSAAEVLAVLYGAVAITFLRAWDQWSSLVLIPFPVLLADWTAVRLKGRLFPRLASWPVLTVALCGVITLGSYGRLAELGGPKIKDDFLYPLRANPTPEPLTEEERSAAIAMVRGALLGRGAVEAPGRLAVAHPHPVHVTLFAPVKRKRWTRGTATSGTLGEQLIAAASAARDELVGRHRGVDLATVRIQVDLEGPGQRLGGRWFRGLINDLGHRIAGDNFVWRFAQYDLETGVDGFRLRKGDDEAVVLPADPLLDGWFSPRDLKKRFRYDNWMRTLKELRRRSGLTEDREGPWPAGATLTNFRTYSFAQPDPTTPRTVELHRGHVLFEGELTEERLLSSLQSAGEWLLGTVEDDGRFDYEYFPTRDDHGRGYNEVRHAGSVYGLFHLAELAAKEPTLAARRETYIEAGVRALDRVYGMLDTPPGLDEGAPHVAFVEQKRRGPRVDTGAQALTLLSFLARPTPDSVDAPALAVRLYKDGDDAIIAGLATTLMDLVDERGWVFRRWSDARSGEPMTEQPLYYPGELMLALVLYHEATGDPRALAVTKTVGRAQIAYAKRPWQIPDHWVMQALDRLDALDPDDPTWRDAAYDMGREYTSEQFVPPFQEPHAPDYRGAYRRDMEIARTTRAASRGEAIGGVARIAWRRGDPAQRWERSLIEGARHLIEQTYTADTTWSFPDPDEPIGAIRMGLIDNHCRIDNNQHGIVALDAALHALRRQQ